MENWKLAMYVREVGNQADIFRVAAQDFNTPHMALNPTTNKDDDNWVRLYSALQTMLSAAAVLSKLLWVQQVTVDHQGRELDAEKLRLRDIGLQRAKELLKALKVKQIPILQSQKMRNAFEHFDSRLDEFLDSRDRFWVVDHNVGDARAAASALPDSTDRPIKVLRNFDPKSNTASVLEDKINLQELADAVFKLDEASRLWMATKQNPLEP